MKYLVTIALGCCMLVHATGAFAQSEDPDAQPYLKVGITQKLGAQVPLDLSLRDSQGRVVPLGQYFGERPVVLAMVYYECPMLCGLVLNGLLDAMNQTAKLTAGKDYEVVAISIDHEETYVLADQNKEKFLQDYEQDGVADGIHFMTCEDKDAVYQLAETVGFGFKYDPQSDEFAHGSGIMLITPEGKVSRYLPGTTYPPREFHLGLVETSEGKIGSISDKLFLLCFQYNPETGKYTLLVKNTVKLACLATVGILGSFIFVMFRRDFKSQKLITEEDADTTGGS